MTKMRRLPELNRGLNLPVKRSDAKVHLSNAFWRFYDTNPYTAFLLLDITNLKCQNNCLNKKYTRAFAKQLLSVNIRV